MKTFGQFLGEEDKHRWHASAEELDSHHATRGLHEHFGGLKDHHFSEVEKKGIRTHHASLDQDAKHAINVYKGDADGPSVPKTLRTSGSTITAPKDFVDHVGNLDRATAYKLKEPATLYRGFTGSEDLARLKQGDVHHEHGFLSTTTHKAVARTFSDHESGEDITPNVRHLAAIHMPAGTSGHYIDHNNNTTNEHEFLLARGHKLEVTHHSIHHVYDEDPGRNGFSPPSKHTTPQTYRVTHMKVVGHEQKPLKVES